MRIGFQGRVAFAGRVGARLMTPCARRFDARTFGCVTLAVFLVASIHAYRQPRWYEATAAIKMLEPGNVWEAGAVVDAQIRCGIEVNTFREIMASETMRRRVIARLTPEERNSFLAQHGSARSPSEEEIGRLVMENSAVLAEPKTRIVRIRYRHPDRQMAAKIATLFVEEVVAYEEAVRIAEGRHAYEWLTSRAGSVALEVTRLTGDITLYRESNQRRSPEEWEADANYRSLTHDLDKAKKIQANIGQRLRDLRAENTAPASYCQVAERAAVPMEGDYLTGPLVRDLVCGVGLSSAIGAAAAFAVGSIKRRRSKQTSEETIQ